MKRVLVAETSHRRYGRFDGYHAILYGHEGGAMPKQEKREIAIGDFRQRATELVRRVEETKEPIIITRHGVPVAELRAITADPQALRGSVTILDPDITRPVIDPSDWEAAR